MFVEKLTVSYNPGLRGSGVLLTSLALRYLRLCEKLPCSTQSRKERKEIAKVEKE
jgi:hypothetical protein